MKPLAIISLIGLTVLPLALACSEDEPAARSRLVLVTLDTLRYDRFVPTGDQPGAMPRTWAHAQRGRVFDRFYTVSGVTQPAHATMFTGQPPWVHGITRNGLLLPRRFPSVAEVLRLSGFETRAVVASFPVTRRFGYDRGFDHFTEDFSHNLSEGKALWEGEWKIDEGAFFAMADAVTAHALKALDDAKADHQFFWFHYFDPHAPYGGSSDGDVVRKRDILKAIPEGKAAVEQQLARARTGYDADVAVLDAALDELLDRLEKDSAEYETHILVVADHGESLGEGQSVGHGARLQEAELRVPAFLLSPRVDAGRSNVLASSIDVAPTLLSLVGLQNSDDIDDHPGRGHDLSAQEIERETAYAMRRTAREPGQSEKRIDGTTMIFDGYLFAAIEPDGSMHVGSSAGLLESDPATDDEEEPSPYLQRFAGFEKRLGRGKRNEPLSPDVRRGLEALGYIE